MRSIRLSLLIYFLGLLTAALGVASLLVYRTAQATLKDKEEATRQLIEAQHEERCREEKARLDNALLAQAQDLAKRVKIEVDFSRPKLSPKDRHSVFMATLDMQGLGLLTAPLAPGGHMRSLLWILQARPGSHKDQAAGELRRAAIANITLRTIPREFWVPEGPPVGEYFQIDEIDSLARARPLRSASLKGRLSFPDPQKFAPDQLLHWEVDDYASAPGRVVRRVRLKTSNTPRVTTFPSWQPPPRRSPGRGPARPRPPSQPWTDRPLVLVIQCAEETHARDAALARLREDRDDELLALRARTGGALGEQRNRLLLISAATFGATVLGTFWLIWLGLLPLRRLSDAVSRVSAKDFRLPVEEHRLPRELRPISQRLTATLELLSRAFAREKQATADISHELRTPLAALLTTTELALRKPRSPEQYREGFQDCRLSAQQMNQIVERLLTLARLDAGVDRLRPQAVDVGALAEQCAAVVRPLAEARGLQLAVQDKMMERGPERGPQAPSPPRCTTDPDKLREVLTNLLHNAIQYNKPDGAIELTVGRQNGHLEVEVRDTGIGISPEAREHIFERFYRADPSRNTDDLHAGLGLAIVKEYVDLMGGQIQVQSEVGLGSTFRVQLPVREAIA